jgi:copper-containing nitrite reductase
MKKTHNFAFLFAYLFTALLVSLFLVAGRNSAMAAAPIQATRPNNRAAKPVDIVRDPADVPPAIASRPAAVVNVMLTAKEVVGVLDPSAGTTYRYWTFNGKVPGPMIRVRQGDTVEVTLRNDANSHMTHSIDFHAAIGAGGGAALSQVTPGQSKTFSFEAATPGLFVYHCGTPMIAEHMANGMYGLILVEPEAGLPQVDREYYMMQGEIYTSEPKGKEGLQQFSAAKLMDEKPEYFVFNGAVDALTGQYQMPAKVGETVRVFFGNAGPNATSSTHMVGEIFTHVYQLGSLTSPPLADVQTAGVPSGGAAVLEFAAKTAGKFALMDHAISRMAKGNMAVFDVSGPQNAALMHSGAASQQNAEQAVSGMTAADEASNLESSIGTPAESPNPDRRDTQADASGVSGMMQMRMRMGTHEIATSGRNDRVPRQKPIASGKTTSLDGCLTLAADGKVVLTAIQSAKVYRLEAQPLLFSQNADRLVHVSGYFGSVLSAEDPNLPSFVVSTVEAVAPTCRANLSSAQIRKVLMKRADAERGVVSMSDMGFLPKILEVNVGEKVVWKNTSEVTHNVVADPSKALYRVDVKLPSGVRPFGSGYLQPNQSFGHIFEVPGTYHYVCTLHEGSGMKGVIIVKGIESLRASK